MGRWSDILRARRTRDGGVGPWGDWHAVPSSAAIQVRVRRASSDVRPSLYSWSYQFRALVPRRLTFEYRVSDARGGKCDQVASVGPGEVVAGTILLPTPGPIWIDARVRPDGSSPG